MVIVFLEEDAAPSVIFNYPITQFLNQKYSYVSL